MEIMLCLLKFVQKDTWTVQCLISCKKWEDMQMILQLSECLSVTNIYVNKTSLPGVFLFVCNTTVILARLVFKLKEVHKFTDYPYIYIDSF